MSSLYILWDEARLWGLLVRHALQSLGIAYRMVGAEEIGAGILQKNSPAILLVPGGSARHKAEQLEPKGLAAIRDYVNGGGHYLGFCGGAGLGLSGPEGSSLGLCPWKRADYSERLQHLMSGHLRVESGVGPLARSLVASVASNGAGGAGLEPMLPVWWPGHFLPDARAENNGLEVLARYATVPGAPDGNAASPESFYGADFWLADLPVSALPPDAFSLWQDLYGLNISPHFLSGQPCVIHGPFGKGSYTLSYSHLETPCSPFANAWLTGLLKELAGLKGLSAGIPEWDLGLAALEGHQYAGQGFSPAPGKNTVPKSPAQKNPALKNPVWNDPELLRALALLQDAIRTGVEQNLLFIRSPWLIGWRSGLPGAALNNIYAELYTLLQSPPTPQGLALWHRQKENFMRDMEFFATGVKNCLLAERLALTLNKSAPEAISTPLLRAQRDNLFGSPMRPGGLYVTLLRLLDQIIFMHLQCV